MVWNLIINEGELNMILFLGFLFVLEIMLIKILHWKKYKEWIKDV